ncbi:MULTISPECIES: transposase family protein [unclassified Micromonospora]|uniref:transposase family protein n=1 Tax=unclassified Micromonospora TaxID=2617518 RepID=UPI003A861E67
MLTELDPTAQYIVDGTLFPCWSWCTDRCLYSGKHKTTGMSVQVARTLDGALAWVSDPVTGNRHDSYAINGTGVLVSLDPGDWIGDKGYVGDGMITPYKKPKGGELAERQKECNRQVNKIRWVVEQVIANLKTWRILHTDYRRPLSTFTETISCVIGLHFYRIACE